MKKYIAILSVFLFLGCSSEKAWDCFQTAGQIVEQEFDAEGFNKIIIWERVQLIFAQGPEYRVVVKTGENLMNEIRVRVEDSILKVSDRNSCNFVRDIGITQVFVTTPTLKEIRNSSGLPVEGRGIIKFDNLLLLSEDREVEDEFHIDGDFNIDNLDVGVLSIGANGISTFRLSGKAFSANFGIFDGDARIEAENLEIENLSIFHRGTSPMIVSPRNAIRGTITGIGDVISTTRPPIVEVEELFRGRLIFR